MTSRPEHTEPIAFVGTQAAQARLEKLRSRPGAGRRVAKIRDEMAEADRVYAENLVSRVRNSLSKEAVQFVARKSPFCPDTGVVSGRNGGAASGELGGRTAANF
jgi:hypothetical protein